MTTAIPSIWLIVPVSSIIALVAALLFYKNLMKKPEGNQKMKEIAQYVREGAMAYLKRQYKTVSVVFVVLSLMLIVLAVLGVQNPFVPIAFISGGFFSGLCGFLGMKAATQASSRTAQGATQSLNNALQIAFRGGAVMGMVVVGFGLLDIAAWYWFLNYVFDNNIFGMGIEDPWQKMTAITTIMLTFGMGASVQALFARVGGGIYTKAADVGADLVGKVEANIPEDDPRNPATIADNVGDNVGDVAGMGADLYESYCVSILATAALGAAVFPHLGVNAIIAPMLVAAVGILFSLAGIMFVRTKEDASSKDLLRSLLTGTLGSSVLTLIAVAVLAGTGIITWGIFGSVITGLVVGVIIGQFTEYYTSDSYKPTQSIAEQAKLGHATTILEGISVGMKSVGFPVISIVVGIILAFGFADGFNNLLMGLYGIGFASVGMLSTLGITLATDAFGPIADNAGGNAEMSGLAPEVRKRTDELDMLGNTTAATGKGFAIGSAALAAMALIAAYIGETQLWLGKLASKSADGIFKAGSVIFTNTNEKLSQHFAGNSGIKVLESGKAINLESGTLVGMSAQNVNIVDFMTAYNLTLMNPMLLGGMFIGTMLIFVFSSMTIHAVGKAAGAMVEEVRRQFREIKGIMDGSGKPDYARCVEISTLGAQKEMIVPSLMAVLVPIFTGLLLGVPGVVGLLIGSLVAGLPLATFLNNSGGAWDNAKKFIEKGNIGGKGSEAHKAAVTGDTVGDPFKDTSGPSLNTLMKLISVVSIVFVGLVIKYSEVIMGVFR
ncbi:MAG: sodium-translocating pyrophosphatase [Fibromonadaceae bacterium]|jgi:K(+)-stimulated pyrophosphate-energized sodium pump|nr:sodium-translocating pyrophosphatase [Fibromonadaceae bacterium]